MMPDLRPEIRRGEAVRVADEWFRVSTMEDRKVGGGNGVVGGWSKDVLPKVGSV